MVRKVHLIRMSVFCLCLILLHSLSLDNSVLVHAETTNDDMEALFSHYCFRMETIPDVFNGRIEDFDVAENGWILLLLDDSHVLVLDDKEQPAAYFAYTATNEAGSQNLIWKDGNIVLFFFKSQCSLCFSVEGKHISATRHDPHERKTDYAEVRDRDMKFNMEVNGRRYSLKKADNAFETFCCIWSSTGSRSLIVTEKDGTQRTIYHGRAADGDFLMYAAITGLFGIIFAIRFFLHRKANRKKSE